jgi:hypothetical protein
MEIISVIEDPLVVMSILVHLKLWDVPPRPPSGGISSSDTISDDDLRRSGKLALQELGHFPMRAARR